MHRKGDPLVLYNVRDAGGAKTLAAAGAQAVGTGRWSMAAAHGCVLEDLRQYRSSDADARGDGAAGSLTLVSKVARLGVARPSHGPAPFTTAMEDLSERQSLAMAS